MDNSKDLAIAIFGNGVALAGLLLVFIGFAQARAESMTNTVKAAKVKNAARAGIIPFGIALTSAWFSMSYIQGDLSVFAFAVWSMRTALALTGFYAFVVLFVYL